MNGSSVCYMADMRKVSGIWKICILGVHGLRKGTYDSIDRYGTYVSDAKSAMETEENC